MTGVPSSCPDPVTTCRTSRGKPGLFQQLRRPQRGVRRLAVRLGDDRVARGERRKSITDAERQRVVPRRDHPDDTLRVVILPGLGQAREGPGAAVGPQEARGGPGVVAAHLRDVDDLLEGVPAGLAVFQLDQIEHRVLPGEQERREAQQHLRPLRGGQPAPVPLRPARGLRGRRDVVRGSARDMPEYGPGRWHLDREQLPGACGNGAGRQPVEQAAGDPRAEKPRPGDCLAACRCRHCRLLRAWPRLAAGECSAV